MTIRDVVKPELESMFQVDEVAVNGLSDQALEAMDAHLNFIYELPGKLDELFTENGENFIGEVRAVLDALAGAGGITSELLPRSSNLLTALEVANAINVEQLDEEMPVGWNGFRLDEDLTFEGVYDSNGELRTIFFYQHPADLTESVGYLDFTHPNALITSSALDDSPRLNVVALLLICRAGEPLAAKRWLLSCSDLAEKRQALLKYQALLAGCLLTRPVLSPSYDGVGGIAETLYRAGSYEQFKEPFEMLSEFNGRKTILDSYLSAYHTLENYMVRARIVDVERRHNGSTFFSIRQFKRMHAATLEGENAQLKQLFKDCWSLSIGGTDFSQYVDARVAHLAGSLGNQGLLTPDFLQLLDRLGVAPNLNSPELEKKRNATSSLVYQIRCSIVHNKETEYHISNRELQNPAIKSVFIDFCIPVMRRLAFGLPSVVASNPIFYSRREIHLY
ncbi:hypothetical protein [Rhizobium leguminosarum]|uniref:hypothetical protein n=1 Tax=Rhizobium leguminosarum TaxID=384 RepID=UPI00103025A1|nr:hypothetical protein [Rhizobium leguminosarum]TBF65679.1 hypothetical protein ELG89_34555 [Rhizobium leguminosarum]